MDILEGENIFIFMDEIDSWNLFLYNIKRQGSYI